MYPQPAATQFGVPQFANPAAAYPGGSYLTATQGGTGFSPTFFQSTPPSPYPPVQPGGGPVPYATNLPLATQLDLADGRLDGTFFGVPIVEQKAAVDSPQIVAPADVAERLDAADGANDGRYFGAPIIATQPSAAQYQVSVPEPVSQEPETQYYVPQGNTSVPPQASVYSQNQSVPMASAEPVESRVVYQTSVRPRPPAHLRPDVFEESYEEEAPPFSAEPLYAPNGLGDWTSKLPWKVEPNALQRAVDDQYTADQRAKAEREAERAALVRELEKAKEAYEKAAKKIVEVPVYKDVYVTEGDGKASTSVAAVAHSTTGDGPVGPGKAQRLGLMMAGPLKGQIVPVDADGRPVLDGLAGDVSTATAAASTAGHGGVASGAHTSAAHANQGGVAVGEHARLGRMVGGPLDGQVLPIDDEGRPILGGQAQQRHGKMLGQMVGGPLHGMVMPVDEEGHPAGPPLGMMGPMGPIGPMGPMGPIGPMGPMGPMGLMGPMGPMGAMGLLGRGGPGVPLMMPPVTAPGMMAPGMIPPMGPMVPAGAAVPMVPPMVPIALPGAAAGLVPAMGSVPPVFPPGLAGPMVPAGPIPVTGVPGAGVVPLMAPLGPAQPGYPGMVPLLRPGGPRPIPVQPNVGPVVPVTAGGRPAIAGMAY